ncbi:hypothetical protein WS71_22730 [Burkholderia mayonis]|uniref:PRTRC system protein F n=2 Tax=Burkholderia mayonis TaxID=1385591 RepID=A0A1B4G2B7_9BURK|nr:hypothetical protein WS71_22730 [Burkholderia mayonis]KVE49009.1 hypothetical protein WS71_17120 [Burkholderia mayonis]
MGLVEMVSAHFSYGPLRAADVENPADARDAFKQGFTAWLERIGMERRFVSYDPILLDRDLVHQMIEYRCNGDESYLTSPFYLGLEMIGEDVYSLAPFVGRGEAIHPLLVPTVLSVLDRASCMTGLIRTPGWFLCEFARHHWEYNESATDEQAIEWIREMHEGDDEAIERLLPSVVRPEIYPESVRRPRKVPGRRSNSGSLFERELLALRDSTDGAMATVCEELSTLKRLLRAAGKRRLLGDGVDGLPIYSLATVVFEENDRVTEILDDHYNYASQGCEETCFNTFIPFATNRGAIAQQYRDFALGFRMMNQVDRLLAALTNF